MDVKDLSLTFYTKHKHGNGFVSRCPPLLSRLSLNVIFWPVKLTGDPWNANISVESVTDVLCALLACGLTPLSADLRSVRPGDAKQLAPEPHLRHVSVPQQAGEQRIPGQCRHTSHAGSFTPSTLILYLLSTLSGTCEGPGGAADRSSGRSVCQEIHGFQLGPVPFHLGAGSIIITHPDRLSLTLQRVYGIRFSQFGNLEEMDCLIAVT